MKNIMEKPKIHAVLHIVLEPFDGEGVELVCGVFLIFHFSVFGRTNIV